MARTPRRSRRPRQARLNTAVEEEVVLTPFALSPCEGQPDLYVLPMPLSVAQAYISTTALWVADNPDVQQIVANSPSYLEALAQVRGRITLPPGQGHEFLSWWGGLSEAEKETIRKKERFIDRDAHGMVLSRLNSLKGAWVEQAVNQARAGLDREGTRPPSFGIYSQYLGAPGTGESRRSAFGNPAPSHSEGAGSLTELIQGWHGILGKKSLRDLSDEIPTFYVAGKKDGAPVVIVLTGKMDDLRGMDIGSSELQIRGQGENTDLMGVLDAVIWARRDKLSTHLCFLLPPATEAKRAGEVTKSARFQRRVFGLFTRTDLFDSLWSIYFGSLARTTEDPKVLRRLEGYAKRLQTKVKDEGMQLQMSRPKSTWRLYYGSPFALQDWAGQYMTALGKGLRAGENRAGFTKKLALWFDLSSRGTEDIEAQTLTYTALAHEDKRTLGEKDELDVLSKSVGKMSHWLSKFIIAKEDRAIGKRLTPEQQATLSLSEVAAKSFIPLRNVPADEKAVVFFMQNLDGRSPGSGMYIPGIIEIWRIQRARDDRQKRKMPVYKLVGRELLLPEDALQDYYSQWENTAKRSKLLPLVMVEVGLYNLQNAMVTPALVQADRNKPASEWVWGPQPKAVKKALTKGAYHLPFAFKGAWYLGISSATLADQEVEDEQYPGGMRFKGIPQIFYPGLKSVQQVARTLCRVHEVIGAAGPELRILPGYEKAPWTSEAVPYLFSTVPVWDKELGKAVLTSASDDPKAYAKGVKSAFRGSPPPDLVVGGRGARAAGRALIGGSARSHVLRPKSHEVASSAPRRPWGFFSLADKTLKEKGLVAGVKSRAGKDVKQIALDAVIERSWPHLLERINHVRESFGEPLYSEGTPSPTRPLAGEDAEARAQRKDLEYQALLVLEALMGPVTDAMEASVAADRKKAGQLRQRGQKGDERRAEQYEAKAERDALDLDGRKAIKGLFGLQPHETDPELLALSLPALRPRDAFGTEGGWRDFMDNFDPEFEEEISAVRNPRRKRARRTKRRPRRGHRNPLTVEDADSLAEWMGGEPGEPSPDITLSPDLSDPASFSEGIKALFPQGRPLGDLSYKDRLTALAQQQGDVIASLATPGQDPAEEEAILKALASGADLSGQSRYLGDRAALSAGEVKGLLDLRKDDKKRNRTVTPSGAVCLRYRNMPRLKGYKPPPHVLEANTAWIWVAPPLQEAGKGRVMTFRNGYHIDCDMRPTKGLPLGMLISRAIEGMVLWLAEKPARRQRIRYVNLGVVGSNQARHLWYSTPDDSWPLDPRAMLRRSQDPGATVTLESAGSAASYSPSGDKKNYIRAASALQLHRDKLSPALARLIEHGPASRAALPPAAPPPAVAVSGPLPRLEPREAAPAPPRKTVVKRPPPRMKDLLSRRLPPEEPGSEE